MIDSGKRRTLSQIENDSRNGGLLRFTPDPLEITKAKKTGHYGSVLTSRGISEWLVLEPARKSPSETKGTFRWTSNRKKGDRNAEQYYAYSEGIDIRDGLLFFTCKKIKSLFILNLDDVTYTTVETRQKKENLTANQIKLLGS